MNQRFRRPASLSLAQQDLLPGEQDPARAADLAHSSAAALLHQIRESPDEDVVRRVVGLAQDEGLEDLAALWSSSPPNTLPGALWRLYLVRAWAAHDPEDFVRRYREGTGTAPGLRYLAGLAEPPDVPAVQRTLDEILRGAFTGDLGLALRRAAAVLTLVAYGTAHVADSEVDPDRQRELTLQAGRLLTTAEDLGIAGRSEEIVGLD